MHFLVLVIQIELRAIHVPCTLCPTLVSTVSAFTQAIQTSFVELIVAEDPHGDGVIDVQDQTAVVLGWGECGR